MDTSQYKKFADEVLELSFNDLELLITAFTHRSYVNEHKKSTKVHNERLEFLGDAVLELVVTEHLYKNFEEPEGILTNWRSALVRTESIGAAANNIGLDPLLRLSKGEKRGTPRARLQILANTFEAVIGAIYLDQGYDAAAKFIEATILSTLDQILETGSWMDPKSHLQEASQANEGFTPIYKVLGEEGPDHDKIFTIGVFVNGVLRGKGEGPSKQQGQQQAASEALKYYKSLTDVKTD